MITFENVSFEDIRPYHEIEMYRQLLRLYLPIQKRCLVQNNIKPNNIDILSPFKGSFPKQDEIKDTYQTCGETTLVNDNFHLRVRQIRFPISPDESFTFNHLIFPNCFYELCDTKQPIHIVYSQAYDIMFICFGTGERYLDIRSLDHAVTVENQYVKRNTVNKELFVEFLKMINSINNISNIILCGHSHGMNSAIVTAFILQAIRIPDFCEKNHRIIGSWIDDITLWRNEFNTLKDKKICVVGTGGSPVLFINQTEFKNFYESLQGAFVHILSGILIDDSVYIDNFGSPLYDLRHYKYGIYYTNTYISDKMITHKRYVFTR